MKSNKETAREYAQHALEVSDNIKDAALAVLRSLRRGNDVWETHMKTLMIYMADTSNEGDDDVRPNEMETDRHVQGDER